MLLNLVSLLPNKSTATCGPTARDRVDIHVSIQIDSWKVTRYGTYLVIGTLYTARASSIYKTQTRPLVREGAPQKQDCNCRTVKMSGHEPHMGLDIKCDWLTVSRNVTLTLTEWNQSCKQGFAHHLKFSEVHTGPRFAHSFQPSIYVYTII
jgi:hypothetical protein